MVTGSTRRTRLKSYLCMGCGKYFPKRAIEMVGGVAYCKNCKSKAQEFKETLHSEREAILTGIEGSEVSLGEDDDKWEKAWSSKEMISITPERLERLPHPVPLGGLEAPVTSRIYSRLIDYCLVAFVVFILDVLFHLTVVASWIFGDLGLKAGDYQYQNILDPTGWHILLSNLDVARKVGFVVVAVLALYRIPQMIIGKRTLGESIAGVMLTSKDGKFPGLGGRVLKGIVTTLGEAALVGPAVDLVLYMTTHPKVTLSEGLADLRAVRYESWKSTVSELLHKASLLRTGGTAAAGSSPAHHLS